MTIEDKSRPARSPTGVYKHGYSGYTHACRCGVCRAEYTRDRKKADASQYARNKAMLDELKANPCVDCGGKFPPEAMDFDHINGEKVKQVSALLKHGKPKLLAEIAKCELVCANCHRVRTRARYADSR